MTGGVPGKRTEPRLGGDVWMAQGMIMSPAGTLWLHGRRPSSRNSSGPQAISGEALRDIDSEKDWEKLAEGLALDDDDHDSLLDREWLGDADRLSEWECECDGLSLELRDTDRLLEDD